MDENPHTYAGFPHTYGPPKMTENHGVLGPNPGPATQKVLQMAEKQGVLAVSPEPFVNGVSTAGSRKGLI
jgi:hypothetical protein